nr:hypothetical protein [Lysinibacillus timonensis]
MKLIGWAFVATVLLFILSLLIISPILSSFGYYDSVEGSYHQVTHSLIFTLIFTVIVSAIISTQVIIEKLDNHKQDD